MCIDSVDVVLLREDVGPRSRYTAGPGWILRFGKNAGAKAGEKEGEAKPRHMVQGPDPEGTGVSGIGGGFAMSVPGG